MGNTATAGWATVHARTAALRDVVTALDSGQDLPWDETASELFADRTELLQELHALWSRRLQGRLDLALELDACSLEESVATAWLHTTADLPGVRRVLDAHADDPALRQLERSQLRLVAVAAGLATFDDPLTRSASAGARLVRGARGRSPARAARPSFGTRLRLALAG
jgi:hypothetical protein